MCIRDSLDTLATYHEQHRDEPGPGRERLRRMALPMEDEALVPVSYTHLDVYKRQVER